MYIYRVYCQALASWIAAHGRYPAGEAGALSRSLVAAHDGPVWGLQRWAAAAEIVASAGADGAVRLWDARQATVVHELAAECAVYALAAGATHALTGPDHVAGVLARGRPHVRGQPRRLRAARRRGVKQPFSPEEAKTA